MNSLRPLEILWEGGGGRRVPLPSALSRVYGPLRIPPQADRPHVVGNFASTLDGVVALRASGASSGGEITGFDPHDRMLMGILRAIADVVIVGAGTLRAVPRHTWTAEHVYAPTAEAFGALRRRLGKPAVPVNVVVTASGRLDLRLPVFSRGEVPVLIVTTTSGARQLAVPEGDPSVRVVAVRRTGPLRAADVLRVVQARVRPHFVLVEGGPHLIGSFFGERRLDELFLTLAPQVAGRDRNPRPGMVEGRTFAPEHPLWLSLTDVRRGGDLLFLRYARPATGGPSERTHRVGCRDA